MNRFVSRALFFSLCLLLVVVWLPSYFVFGSVDTWRLIINTIATIVTFLLELRQAVGLEDRGSAYKRLTTPWVRQPRAC